MSGSIRQRAPFSVCGVCHGVHKGIPECVGRAQTEVEWMVDRGVRDWRARDIVAARERASLGSIVAPPDPFASTGPPFGVPPPDQGALF